MAPNTFVVNLSWMSSPGYVRPMAAPGIGAQTHLTLRPFLIEEAYEALDALDRGNVHDLAEELGDLLLQIGLHAQIGVEQGEFTMSDVIEGISTKLIRPPSACLFLS